MKFILSILLFVTFPIYGANYYVSSTGNNTTGDGSIETPWATLSYACSQVIPHNTIIVMNDITDNNRCVVARNVNLLGIGTPTVTTSYAASSVNDGFLYLVSSSGNAVDASQTISYLHFDGNSTTSTRAGIVAYRSNVKIFGCTFTNFKYSGIRFKGTTSGYSTTPTNTLPTGCEVYNCTFNNNSTRVGNGDGGHIRMEGMDGMKIYNSNFTQNSRAKGYNGNIISGYQNEACEIYGNTFTKNDSEWNTSLLSVETWNFFAELHYSRGGMIFRNNTSNGAASWDLSGSVSGDYDFGWRVYESTFQTTSSPVYDAHNQAFIDLESFAYENDIEIYRCYFKYARIGIHLNNIYTSGDNIDIHSNVFEKCGTLSYTSNGAIKVESSWDGSTPITLSNIYIDNNTIDISAASTAAIGVQTIGLISNLNIRNNIIQGNCTYPIRFTSVGSPTISVLNILNNNFYDCGSISYSSSINYVNRVATGNLDTDPSFMSSADFRLAVGSDMIGAGIDIGLDYDYIGNPWADTPSIGAYEYAFPIEPPIEVDYPGTPLIYKNRFIILINRLLKLE